MLGPEVNNLEKITKFALGLFFPVFCLGCGREGRYICARCLVFVGEASLICPVCENSTFTGETHEACQGRYTLDGLIGVWEYEGVIKQLLLQIKYRGMGHAVQETVEAAFLAMAKDTARFSSFLSFLFEQETAFAYVPMWKPKERQRGHNQALLIARSLWELSSQAGAQLPSSKPAKLQALLQKIKDTSSQTELNKEQRLKNVQDSFIAAWELSSQAGAQLPKRVVLVDDVWTTGATMRECCKVLKKAGTEKVWGFTLARTP